MKKFFLLLLMTFTLPAGLMSQPVSSYNAAEIKLAIEKLNVLGSVLYLAAHPDDENTAVISYFSKGEKYRTGYLSLTRGDGGQNLVGPEKGSLIGIIRTQELLQARRIDGGEQFFSRALDFGYSKTVDETLSFWNKEEVLKDIVYVIRKFRPDVIITRFPTEGFQTHGHHLASAQLAVEAFGLASNSKVYPDQLEYVNTWQPKRVVWDNWIPYFDEKYDTSGLIKCNVGAYSELLGKSFTEISALSRSMHKSQGFGASGSRGSSNAYFSVLAGSEPEENIFEDVNTTWTRVEGAGEVSRLLAKANDEYDITNPAASIPTLIEAYEELQKLKSGSWVDVKKKELKEVIRACAGLWMEAIAEDYSAVPGSDIKLNMQLVNRSGYPFELTNIVYPYNGEAGEDKELTDNTPLEFEKTISIPNNAEYTNPYWLKEEPGIGLFKTEEQSQIGLAEKPTDWHVSFTIKAGDAALDYDIPILYRWVDRVDGELYRRFEVRPAITASFDEKVYVFPNNEPKEILLKVKSAQDSIGGTVSLNFTNGWKVEPASKEFFLTGKYEEAAIKFTVIPPAGQTTSQATFTAAVNGKSYDRSLIEIDHAHIPMQTYMPKAEAKLVRVNVNKVIDNVGYVMGPGDEVPEALTQLGYEVTLLTDDYLGEGDLSRFDAIITGIRAYNTNENMASYNKRLLEYVKNGGTLVVQYNVSFGLVTNEIGPYEFEIERLRIADETRELKILDTAHPLFNYPNKITDADFTDWVQERGVYFAGTWSDKYTPLFEGNDIDEDPQQGATLYVEYGEGVFIYTALSWFRQLPAGVPGAFRIFTNIISGGKE